MLNDPETGKCLEKQKTHQQAHHLSRSPDSSSQRWHRIKMLSLIVYSSELVVQALASEKKDAVLWSNYRNLTLYDKGNTICMVCSFGM